MSGSTSHRQLAFYLDSSACSGCKTCQVACKDKHDLATGQLWRRVYEIAGGEWQARAGAWLQSICAYHVSLACNHCRQPICVEVCPTRAAHQRADGIVLIDSERCIGCRYCSWACPYRAPQYDPARGLMRKCHLCHDLLDQGLAPACVSACPMRALGFGELTELQSQHGSAADIYPLPAADLTQPALVITPHPSLELTGAQSLAIINHEEVRRAGR